MQDDPAGEQQAEEEQGGGFNPEVLRSYLTFAKRAIVARKRLIVGVALCGLVLTGLVAKFIPRTYSCQTVLMTVANAVLDSDRGPQPFAGAENQIMSHENLEILIKDIELKKKYYARRPPLLALKDKLILTLFGPMDDRVLTAVLVGTIETRLQAKAEKETLTIKVDWSDSATAAELAEATKATFLRRRHSAEISAFQEKMAILDTHAGKLREEIDVLANQMKERIAEKRAELEAQAKAEAKAEAKARAEGDAEGAAESKRKATIARIIMASRHKPVTDEQLPDLRERLATLKRNLATAEADRNNRIRDEQAKLSEMQLRLTPSHPQVITQEERVGMASQVSSELALMRAEEGDLESQIRQREAMAKTGKTQYVGGGADTSTSGGATSANEPLPTEILGLLDEKDADPALAAQISGAVVRYGALRDDVRGAQIALDTAQAAFNHRYQVVIPVEAPSNPSKPKVGVIVAVGLVMSLLLAFLLPVLLELRRDVVVETWQVHQLQLPVLAELHLPQRADDGQAPTTPPT